MDLEQTGQIEKWSKAIAAWREGRKFYTPDAIDNATAYDGDGLCLTRGDAMLGKLFLAVSELAEAGEAVRSNDPVQFAEEIADVFIRLFDICGSMNIDIEGAIAAKMRYNAQRPIKHGRHTSL